MKLKEINYEVEGGIRFSSYVNLKDLQEVLTDYFQGRLDDCDVCMDRIYLPTSKWNGGNSLWGECDNDLIRECLQELKKVDGEMYSLLIHSNKYGVDLDRPVLNEYTEALYELAMIVHKKL